MKIHYKKSAVALLTFPMIACSTSPLRSPAQTDNKVSYKYSNHFSCTDKKLTAEDSKKEKWSGLSGLKVGLRSFELWQKSNKKILRPFTSDGCSVSPDGFPGAEPNQQWAQCCIEHDTAYWIGGSAAEKAAADDQLQSCIAQKGYPEIGKVYKLFVKQFGGPDSSQTFRWGYGWNYKRSYSPLSAAEEAMITEEHQKTPKQLRQSLAEETTGLLKMCDTYDYGLQPLNSDEEKIYEILSQKVKNTDVIEWAKFGYFNLEKAEYAVKLQSCSNPVTFVLFKDKRKGPAVISECQNLSLQ